MNCRIAELPNCRIEEPAPRGRMALAQDGVLGQCAGKARVPQGRLDTLWRVLALVRATLREIFDENAYARFLDRHALTPSRAAYAQFLRENARMRERRPRCC